MNKRFTVILVVLVAVFVGLIVFNGKDSSTTNSQTSKPSEHVQGNIEAKVTLLEYGDFQCPACAGYHPVIKEVQAKYGDQLKFQFRNFPLISLHPNALSAHRAAEAADKQGKFWEMHDLLYENQNSWNSSTNPSLIFEQFATSLGLNLDQYKKDVVDPANKDVIDADVAAGKALDLTGTPTFFLNGKKIDNPRDVADFSALIDELLK